MSRYGPVEFCEDGAFIDMESGILLIEARIKVSLAQIKPALVVANLPEIENCMLVKQIEIRNQRLDLCFACHAGASLRANAIVKADVLE